MDSMTDDTTRNSRPAKSPGFGHIENTGPTDREIYAPKFTFEATSTRDIILVDGEPFIGIKRMGGKLPKGFQDRLFSHVADLLTGRKTALWDEQAIYGEYKRDPVHSRANALRNADAQARARDKATSNG